MLDIILTVWSVLLLIVFMVAFVYACVEKEEEEE